MSGPIRQRTIGVSPELLDTEKGAAIALAVLVPRQKGNRMVSGTLQKSVLWTIWAHEGLLIQVPAIAHYAGCHTAAANAAVAVLREQGLVEPIGTPRNRARVYRVNYAALRALGQKYPLVRTRSRRRRSRPQGAKAPLEAAA